eukprot:scaffold5688_cov104-Cylindrotheca_fusiformis.AAC.3
MSKACRRTVAKMTHPGMTIFLWYYKGSKGSEKQIIVVSRRRTPMEMSEIWQEGKKNIESFTIYPEDRF